MIHRCPHLNRNCRPGSLCGPCSGGILRDGEQIIAKMMLRDGIPPDLLERGNAAIRQSTTDVRAQARADHDAWKRGQPVNDGHVADKARADARRLADAADDAARVRAWADHFAAQHEAREAAKRSDPAASAYHDLCDGLQRGRFDAA